MDSSDSSDALIEKKILYKGTQFIPLTDGTKVKFHYQTRTCPENADQQLLDDSKKGNRPMELIIGKKFKLEVWEAILKQMSLNEVAKFRVHKSLVSQYPFVAKALRDIKKPHEERKHCCGMTLQTEGIGYKDLDELFSKPCDLEFIMEIVSIERPEEYERETWQLNEDERRAAIQKYRELGNEFYRNKQIAEAEAKYEAALGIVEQLLTKEKPHDVEWTELMTIKMPLLLNYSQCKLLKEEYYAVIVHCTEVLQFEPNNVKALYRRAKAHVGAWNPDEAKADFAKCMELDVALTKNIERDLKQLESEIKLKDNADKSRLQGLFA